MAKFHRNMPELLKLQSIRIYEGDPAKDDKARYEQAFTLFSKDPRLLACFGQTSDKEKGYFLSTPLSDAVRNNDIPVAKAILDVLSKPENAKSVIKQLADEGRLNTECLSKNPLYCYVPGSDTKELPHYYLYLYKSAEMLALLHEYGYDLNAAEEGATNKSIYRQCVWSFKNSIREERYYEEDKTKIFALMDKAIALGYDLRTKDYQEFTDQPPISLGEYAYYAMGVVTPQYTDRACHILSLFMDRGVDFRDVFTGSNNDEFKRLNGALWDKLSHHAKEACENHLTSTDNKKRAACVRAACAGGMFIPLLNKVMQSDKQVGNHQGLRELISHLDPHWKHEYQFVIETMAGRTSPLQEKMRESSLDKYARDIPFSPGKG